MSETDLARLARSLQIAGAADRIFEVYDGSLPKPEELYRALIAFGFSHAEVESYIVKLFPAREDAGRS